MIHGLLNENTSDDLSSKECPICIDVMLDPVLFPCMHMSCYSCIIDYLQSKEERGEQGECPICRRKLSENELLEIIKQPVSEENGSSSNTQSIRVRKQFKSSTKLNRLIEHLSTLRKSSPDVKSVIFSQFTMMLDMCEVVLADNGFKFVRLDGTMSQPSREKTLSSFNSDQTITVMLASLRSAGVGLNLTAASRVFMLDPWWNAPVEAQTIDRVHRIGQKKNVLVTRFIVRGTVEEKMLKIQERKALLTSTALGMSKDEAKQHRLDDLRVLFT
ncbi:DNA helicase rad5 [Basidiobolus ranarum]|uniref:DNA helicase rad5 n=1 Tax=Basidiobolus ranarum TaxID=34480 RepID=A0ABR2VMB3_9FUNG